MGTARASASSSSSAATFTDVAAYVRAQRRRAAVTVAWEHWFRDHGVDVVLEPTTKCTAPLRGDGYDSGRLGGDGDPLIELTATWNVTGFPVAAFPAGVGARSGLPVGMSLIAPRGAEARRAPGRDRPAGARAATTRTSGP